MASAVNDYILLGLRLGKHIDGMVDAYYGPPELNDQVNAEPVKDPHGLTADARRLLADLASGAADAELDAGRRHWLAAQVGGLHTIARKLAGGEIGYSDEVEACYGVRPRRQPDDVFAEAHKKLDAVLPGVGPLAERYNEWREAQAVPVGTLDAGLHSLAEDLRERTTNLFGFPDGDRIDFELVTNEPWSGFNYYLGGLRSRVAINTDLPVLSPSLAHLVAHEAYPGHHTEHCHKEAGLVRRRHQEEETIFLVGTPQCLLAEGLADLGLEVVMGERPEPTVAEHLRPLGISYDPEVVANVAQASEALNTVRGNVALLLHEDGADLDDAVAYLERWALLSHPRAVKATEFLTDPTWRAYMTCYIEGLPLCRRFVAGDPARFGRLITEQLIPADLA
jgi:hypothetical protein